MPLDSRTSHDLIDDWAIPHGQILFRSTDVVITDPSENVNIRVIGPEGIRVVGPEKARVIGPEIIKVITD